MLISLNWLNDYVDVNIPPDELAHMLTMAGLEVESVDPLYPGMDRVIVARIKRIVPHQNADKLKICHVETGQDVVPVVCGAPNIAENQYVAFAQVGAMLPGGMEVKAVKIRGERSEGMICSERELGIGTDHSGILVIQEEARPGESLIKALGLEDWILEVAITPNRGDCLSYLGIAREVAAILKKRVKYPVVHIEEDGPQIETLTSVTLDDPVRCPRYSARLIEGISVKPSPFWMRSRLEAVGLRSINNVVDVTNFVMLEYGQPLHAFDFDLLDEHRIIVRTASDKEHFVTLDGNEHVLDQDMLLICDGKKGVALAGIMGGENSEIQPGTTNVLIESAFFDPYSIRKTSKKLGIGTESSYRFERRVDPDGVIKALDRAAQLMVEVGGGHLAAGAIDQYPKSFESVCVSISTSKTNSFLGTGFETSEVRELLSSIELDIEPVNGDVTNVSIPSFRGDLTREVDLFEEVARLKGYDHIPATLPAAPLASSLPDEHLLFREKLKDTVSSLGFSEIVTYSFISEELIKKLGFPEGNFRREVVRIKNPLNEAQAVMRTTLIPGLLEILRKNIYRMNENLRMFELSKIFLAHPEGDLPGEPYQLVGGMVGALEKVLLYNQNQMVDFYSLKGVVDGIFSALQIKPRYSLDNIFPYFDKMESASILVEGEIVGGLGLLGKEVAEDYGLKVPVYLFELSVEPLFERGIVTKTFQPIPKFPPVSRDLALVLDQQIAAQEVIDCLLDIHEPLLEEVTIFDLYRGNRLKPGKVSIGYRLIYRAQDRNLTDEEVNEVHERLARTVMSRFNAEFPE